MNIPQTPTAEPLAPLTGSALVEYLKGLKPGERVVETGRSCLQGREGTVYLGKQGEVCVLWDKRPGEGVQSPNKILPFRVRAMFEPAEKQALSQTKL